MTSCAVGKMHGLAARAGLSCLGAFTTLAIWSRGDLRILNFRQFC